MFNGNRRFDGRQGEQILNQEQYVLYEILKHFLDVPDNPAPTFGPNSGLEKPGALWLDRQTSPGYAHVMYHDSDNVWKPLFDDWFKIIKEIRNPNGQPEHPREGQLWINDAGVMHWFNGSVFEPIKSRVADSIDFTAHSFQNFLIIDPLKMSGGYIVENLARLAQISEGITEWKPNFLYQKDAIVYYVDTNNQPKFYKYNDVHTSCMTFEEEILENHVEEVDLKAQYLIPSETLDKIFINGLFADNTIYEKISDVCIQISLNLYQGKVVTAVHVNPIALKNIKKKIVRIEKDVTNFDNYGVIKVGPENTEYYGFKGSYGYLLQKGIDYTPKANGIQLINSLSSSNEYNVYNENNAFTNYDFIYCITYEYETRIQTQGKLYKDTLDLGNRTIIWVGELLPSDKLLVFADGLCLEDFYFYYEDELVYFNGFDSNGKVTAEDKLITKPLFENKTHVAIMRFDKKTTVGVITQDNLENTVIDDGETQYVSNFIDKDGKLKYIAKVPIPKDFLEPLVFVQGPNINLELGDYVVENGFALIKDAIPGSAYYIADAVRNDGFNMKIAHGVVDSSHTIPINDDGILSGDCLPLLFVDGFYISTKDMDISSGSIRINGLQEGQTYVLLKDKLDNKNQLLFDDELSFTTIPVKNFIDDAVVYVNNSLIVDGGACYTTSLDTSEVAHNEIRMLSDAGSSSWHCFNSTIKIDEYGDSIDGKWELITDESFIAILNLASSGYSVGEKTINLLQNFGNVKCTYYAYSFADNIEKPLVKGYTNEVIEQGNELFYKINRGHSYTKGVNGLHVWINGVKQVIRENTIVQIIEEVPVTFQGFNIEKPSNNIEGEFIIDVGILDVNKLGSDFVQFKYSTSWPTAFYIIEEPEEKENKSCNVELISESIGNNVFKTKDILLSPGIPRVFIDGYRQPKESFMINNINTLTFTDRVITKDNPKIMIEDKYGNNKILEVHQPSNVCVEIRQDYTLQEKTIELTKDNLLDMKQGNSLIVSQDVVFYGGQKLPYSLFLAQLSEINVYINGAAYGKEIIKAKNQNILVLNNTEIVNLLKIGDKITFEWR